MIDIHVHLLPGVDDGPDVMENSLAMIHQGVQDGISAAIVTPHLMALHQEKNLNDAFQSLLSKVGEKIELFLGSELLFGPELNLLTQNPVGTFGTGKYTLIELSGFPLPRGFEEELFKLRLKGITPIIAHPERNLFLAKDADEISDMVRYGFLMQVNAGSITGAEGKPAKDATVEMLKRGLIHFIGSDGHDTSTRPFLLSPAYKLVEKITGTRMAEDLFFNNPRKAIRGEEIIP